MTASCDQCGALVPPGDEFCDRCGARVAAPPSVMTPPTPSIGTPSAPSPVAPSAPGSAGPPTVPTGSSSAPTGPVSTGRPAGVKLLPILVAALVLAVGVLGWWVVAKPSGTSSGGSSGNTVAAPPADQTAYAVGTLTAPTDRQTSPSTTTTAATSTSVTTTTVPSIDPETAAQQQIQQIVAADRNRVAGILGQWVPQLSSKQVGLADPEDPWYPGQPYTNQMILQAYKNYQQQYPSAMMVPSSDYPSFTFPGYWVVVLEMPFSTQDEALDWCDARGISRNNCIGTKIHS